MLHTASSKSAGAVGKETWPGGARGLIQYNDDFSSLLSQSGHVSCDVSLTLVLGCLFTPRSTEVDTLANKETWRTSPCPGEVTSRQSLLKWGGGGTLTPVSLKGHILLRWENLPPSFSICLKTPLWHPPRLDHLIRMLQRATGHTPLHHMPGLGGVGIFVLYPSSQACYSPPLFLLSRKERVCSLWGVASSISHTWQIGGHLNRIPQCVLVFPIKLEVWIYISKTTG